MKIEILYVTDLASESINIEPLLAVDYNDKLDRDFLIQRLDYWVFDCEEELNGDDAEEFNKALDDIIDGKKVFYYGYSFFWKTTELQSLT